MDEWVEKIVSDFRRFSASYARHCMQNEEEHSLPYSVGSQTWQYVANREAQVMASGVALIDLSMFTKIDGVVLLFSFS